MAHYKSGNSGHDRFDVDQFKPAPLIREAVQKLGLSGHVVELPAAEAAEIRARFEATFLTPGLEWSWERMLSGVVFWKNTPDWSPMNILPALCPPGPAFLLPVYDDDGEVFTASSEIIPKVLAESVSSEYAIADRDLAWIVIVNHHKAVFGAGEPIVTRLLESIGQPGGQGARFAKP